jgi:hypothetical protein
MHDIVQGPNDVDLHFYKTSPKRLKWKKLEPMMVNDGFFQKKHWELPTNIHLFKVEMGEEY